VATPATSGTNSPTPNPSVGNGTIADQYARAMSRVRLRAEGQLTLPEEVRSAAQLEVGDLLDVELTDEGILLRPQRVIDSSQAWFWTPSWQEGEAEAEADRKAGHVETFRSGEHFLDTMGERAKGQRARS